MSDKKNIDKLFQEKFKDYEVRPADDLWGNIEAKLAEKKRKRVIPFWWKLSGLVAILVMGTLITKTLINDDSSPKNSVVNQEDSKQNHGEGDLKNGIPNKMENTTEGITNRENQSNNVLKTDNTDEDSTTGSKQQRSNRNLNSSPIVNDSKTTVAQGRSAKNNASKNKTSSEKSKTSVAENIFVNNENPVTVGKEPSNQTITKNGIAQTDNNDSKSKDVNTISVPKEINLDALKGNNNTIIADKDVEDKVKDTTHTKSSDTNPLEELLAEKEKKSKQESKQNRWQLTSNVAPIFLGSISNGSPIDSTLVNNSKTYNTSVGFGLGVSYAVNSKLTIRTGLNKLNMNYNTNNVYYYATMQTRYLSGLSPTGAGYTLQVESAVPSSSPAALMPSENDLLAFEEAIVHKNEGYIRQEMGFLEMPLEMSYAIVEKRFGLKIISGFSTLFLQDNSISIVANDRTTVLGRANNLNSVHFSTNIGLGIKYGFMKSFELNLEPTFKYQLNTFRADDGNFKPYVFGIYSGISYKF